MIISRYLIRQILMATAAVLLVLLVIFISHEFVRYIGKAASGKISGMVLLRLLTLQIPILIGLLLPLAMYIGILLAYGRCYVDQEMTVLTACGMSRQQLLRTTLCFAMVIALIASFFTCYLNPILMRHKNALLTDVAFNTIVDRLPPGHFKAIQNGKYVFYVENISRDRKQMQGVFIAERTKPQPILPQIKNINPNDKKSSRSNLTRSTQWHITTAKRARQVTDPRTKAKYVRVEQGYRYTGKPGQANYSIMHFAEYSVRIPSDAPPPQASPENVTTSTLWSNRHQAAYAAELQWRIATPISTLLFASIGLLLARTEPRQGRYARVFPAIIIYVIYANMLFVSRKWIATEKVGILMGSLWLHAAALLLIFILWQTTTGKRIPFKPWQFTKKAGQSV